jgi:hypothetical protein
MLTVVPSVDRKCNVGCARTTERRVEERPEQLVSTLRIRPLLHSQGQPQYLTLVSFRRKWLEQIKYNQADYSSDNKATLCWTR